MRIKTLSFQYWPTPRGIKNRRPIFLSDPGAGFDDLLVLPKILARDLGRNHARRFGRDGLEATVVVLVDSVRREDFPEVVQSSAFATSASATRVSVELRFLEALGDRRFSFEISERLAELSKTDLVLEDLDVVRRFPGLSDDEPFVAIAPERCLLELRDGTVGKTSRRVHEATNPAKPGATSELFALAEVELDRFLVTSHATTTLDEFREVTRVEVPSSVPLLLEEALDALGALDLVELLDAAIRLEDGPSFRSVVRIVKERLDVLDKSRRG